VLIPARLESDRPIAEAKPFFFKKEAETFRWSGCGLAGESEANRQTFFDSVLQKRTGLLR
jgi:hypothetical protein